jgi:phosphoglycerate dehydrogenase-like enzyme
VGIIGYGRLGKIFSRLAHGFGMKVMACDPFKKITDPWVKQESLKTLLKRAEIITIHVHLTTETRQMIGKKEFALMRNGVYLVNTSRGAIIDEKAFLHCLKSGKVAGAGLDVLAGELDGWTANERLVQYAKTHNNLIITPHIGGCTYDAQEKAFRHTSLKLTAFLRRALPTPD